MSELGFHWWRSVRRRQLVLLLPALILVIASLGSPTAQSQFAAASDPGAALMQWLQSGTTNGGGGYGGGEAGGGAVSSDSSSTGASDSGSGGSSGGSSSDSSSGSSSGSSSSSSGGSSSDSSSGSTSGSSSDSSSGSTGGSSSDSSSGGVDLSRGIGFSSGGATDVFELPNPPSKFDPTAAWHHMRYRTPETCWSQQERHLYHTADQSPPSQGFLDAVVEYEAMQRECVSQGGVEQWEWVKDRQKWEQDGPRHGPDRKLCRFIVAHDLNRGVGNRIVSYVISFILGLLTNRAIIVPPLGFLTRRFCNPFARANTSWTVDPATYDLLMTTVIPEPRLQLSVMARIMTAMARKGQVDAGKVLLNGMVQRNGSVWIDLHVRGYHYFCDLPWLAADVAPFWYSSSDAYSLPSFFYMPHIADKLIELFPDRRVFTHVTRFLMHPDNRLWAKITYTFLANLAHFPHRLGLQVRSPDAIDLPLARRILRCGVLVAKYLPATRPYPLDPSMAMLGMGDGNGTGGSDGNGGGADNGPSYRSFRTMGVFVSSLNIRHMLDLEAHYAQHLTVGNTFVSFWSLTNEGQETRREVQLIDAVMDMWLLSFSDRLLITHVSSFGRTAVGLAGIDAYSMQITVIKMRKVDWRNMSGPVCERVSSEPCDTMGMPVLQSGCSWDFNRSRLKLGWQRPEGFGFCPGMRFGVQDRYPLQNLPTR